MPFRILRSARVILVQLVVLMGLCVSPVIAQFTSPAITQPPTLPGASKVPQRQSATVNPEAMVFDGYIDPKEYHMGPGDLLEMQLWTSDESFQLSVSPDEILIVPHIGEFDVHGKTLAQLRDEIVKQAVGIFKSKTVNHGSPISLSLLQPRRIYVKVRGDVNYPEVYTLTSATRADIAIDLANRPLVQSTEVFSDDARLRDEDRKRRQAEQLRPFLGTTGETSASERYITIIHSDGSTDRVDLLRYDATKDPRFCPVLREGDEIFVPYKKRLEGQIGVYGGVLAPGDYEYVMGDSLTSMLQNVFGTSSTADLHHVELTRMSQAGTDYQTYYYDVTAIRNGSAPDVPLMRGDRIFVRDTSDLRELSRVIVKGEVREPGVYPIQRGVTKLSWIIHNAGGFTPNAFLRGGSVLRSRLDLQISDNTPEDDAMEVQRLANLQVTDSTNFKLQSRLRSGDADVDMYRLFQLGDSTADLTLRNGDIITIPTTPNDVYVWGYVGKAGYVPFSMGKNLAYYIDLAGGYSEGAVPSGTRIIKAHTRQWMDPEKTQIEPGDEIFVPKTPDHSENYTLQTVASIAGIVLGIAGAIISILYYYKK